MRFSFVSVKKDHTVQIMNCCCHIMYSKHLFPISFFEIKTFCIKLGKYKKKNFPHCGNTLEGTFLNDKASL